MTSLTKSLALIALAGIVSMSQGTAQASGGNLEDLYHLIAFEDSRMDLQDLAFFLVTHNFDASPLDGYVQLNLDGKIFRLVPNGERPGLCDIEPIA